MDGNCLRSSACVSRKRNVYTRMLPDSKFSEINCVRTKAGYLIRLGIAPFVIIMQQCSAILDVKKVPEYSETRYILNMYTIVESITDQFPVIEKVVRLDKAETELKQIVSSKFMPVHWDQFYKLHSKSTRDPPEFVAKNKDFHYSSYSLFYHELCKMTDKEITDVREQWSSFDVFLLGKLLVRFSIFPSSTVVRMIYLIFLPSGLLNFAEWPASTCRRVSHLANECPRRVCTTEGK